MRKVTPFRAATIAALLLTALPSSAEPLPIDVGTSVRDMVGGTVGAVTSVGDGTVTVRTDRHEVQIPAASTVVHNGALLIAMTRAELNAEVDRLLAARGATAATALASRTSSAVIPGQPEQ